MLNKMLAASATALLLTSTAAFAQEDASGASGNVYLDVGGTIYSVPVALAAQACGMDEASVQAMASTMTTGGTDGETASADPADSEAAPSTDVPATIAAESSAGEQSIDEESDIASTENADNTLANAEQTAADSGIAQADVSMASMSICQVDATTAASLGIQ